MSHALVTIEGRLTADPVLRLTTGNGHSVANFTVAHTPRKRNAAGDWEDSGDTLFLRVTAWRELAENAAASLHKGDAVVVIGRLGVRLFKNNAGEDRMEVVCDADTLAVDLRRATASVTRFSAAPASVPEDWAPSKV